MTTSLGDERVTSYVDDCSWPGFNTKSSSRWTFWMTSTAEVKYFWWVVYMHVFGGFFWFICLGVFVPLDFFFNHMETSPLPMKGCKFWLILGTYMYSHWAVRGFWRATPTVTWDIRLECSKPRTRDTGTCCRALGQWICHYLFIRHRPVATEDWTPISRMRGKRSYYWATICLIYMYLCILLLFNIKYILKHKWKGCKQ